MKIRDYLPKNEYDYDSIIRMAELSDADFRKIALDVLAYLKDEDCPLFSMAVDVLVLHQSVITDSIRMTFTEDDYVWKSNILTNLIVRLNANNKEKLRSLVNNSCNDIKLKEAAELCADYCFNHKPLIRPAGLFDAPGLADVKLLIWKETFLGIYPEEKIRNYDHKKYEKYFNDQIDNSEVSLYVVECDSEMCGYMCCGTAAKPYHGITQELSQLNLLRKIQHQHIGKKLFLLASEIISFKGYDEMCLCCNKYNYPAQEFYEKMGCEIIDIDEDNEDHSLPQIHYLYRINRNEDRNEKDCHNYQIS